MRHRTVLSSPVLPRAQPRQLDAHIDELEIPNATVMEFVDNGFTGTNMARLALHEMLICVMIFDRNTLKGYTRSVKYDANWIEKNWMGPNPLWLIEDVCAHLDLSPGMKVLDMGCGKGITSIFLAKEFGVTVFATDVCISATDNQRRFEEAGVADKVFPIHAEAHALPYAEGFFDVAIAIDCYHYFGACESYFVDVFSKLVKPGGQFAFVVPGLKKEFETCLQDIEPSPSCILVHLPHARGSFHVVGEAFVKIISYCP